MSSRLIIEGENNKIQRLIEKVRASKLFRFYHSSKFFINKHESRLEYYIDEQNQLKERDKRDITTVNLKTTNGKHITIDLLDTKVVDMASGTTLIIGKNFDIFAVPEEK
ncbi:hypothetical protein [Shimazuella kribbensis]|uniref:hypothetical protein n=1 Tax=Shimazuella kribbensis TaxID=139808 RepID=UPI000415060C|nr:hypothetical protein [Shimazuella kribbensis]